jgi:hypothetical protein
MKTINHPKRVAPTELASWERASSLSAPFGLCADLCWLRGVWTEFQTARKRDAVYAYLGGVFDVIIWWIRKCHLFRRVRSSLHICGGDCSKMRDPVSAIIFCSANPGQIDRKTRSKWSRVLWYAAHYKPGSERLDAFIKRKGGINECAERYTERLGRPDRNVMYSLKKRCRKLHRLLRKKMKAGPLVSNFC